MGPSHPPPGGDARRPSHGHLLPPAQGVAERRNGVELHPLGVRTRDVAECRDLEARAQELDDPGRHGARRPDGSTARRHRHRRADVLDPRYRPVCARRHPAGRLPRHPRRGAGVCAQPDAHRPAAGRELRPAQPESKGQLMQVLPGPLVAASDDEVLAAPAAGLAPSRRVLRRFLRKPSAVVAAAFVLVVAIGCTFASWLARYGANDRVPGGAHQPPGAHYLLGTDGTGRDILSRLMFGGQVSLRVIVAVVALALAVAVPVGVLAGFKGGGIDLVIMRLVEAGSAVPPLILALCVAGVLGPGVNNVIFALALVMVPGLVRLARGSALAVAAEPFIEASKAIGTPTTRIAVHRVFPNVRSVIIVQVAFLLSGALLAEAGLSYLGIGAQPPTPTWGNMLRQAYDTSLFTDAWQVIAPAIVLVATVFAFNTIADGLRDAFGLAAAPKRRHRVQGGGLGLTAVSRSAAPPAATDEQGDDVLRVSELSVVFDGDDGSTKVVDNVSFTVRNGEILGLVGESGCGKSVTSLALM